MKTPVLLLLLVYCNLADAYPVKENEELVYYYNSRVATGLATNVKQFSVFGTKGKLIIRNQNNVMYLKLKNILIGKINKQFEQDFAEEIKFEYADPSGPLADFLQHLEKPIRVIFENGLVKSFDASVDDPLWSINFKKALLAMIQVSDEDTTDNDRESFQIQEDSINGRCRTVYRRTNLPSDKDPTKAVQHIMKRRLLDSCEDAAEQNFNNLWGLKCTNGDIHYQNVQNRLKKSSTVFYVIGEDGYPVKVNGLNFITSDPYGSNGENPLSAVNQTLMFIEKRAADDEDVQLKGDTVTYNSLKYKFHGSIRNPETDSKEGHHYNRLAAIQIKDYFEKAHQKLESITEAALNPEKPNLHGDQDFLHLVRILYAFSFDDFKTFFEKNLSGDDQMISKRRKIFIEALPRIGTSPAVLFILHLVKLEDESVSNLEKHLMLTVAPFHAKEPTLKVVQEFRELARKSFVRPKSGIMDQFESEELLSATGTMLFVGCKRRPSGADINTHFISKEDCSKQLAGLVEDFEKATNVRSQIIYTKAIINTRISEGKNLLFKIIEGNYEDILKRLAMWGLVSNFDADNPKFYRIFSTIARNTTEDYVSRIYAYELLIYLASDFNDVTGYAYEIMKDSNKHFVSYMYQFLQTLANTKEPCFSYLGEHVKYILKFLQPPEEAENYSTIKSLNFYNEKYQYGRTADYIIIGNNKGVFPREIYMRQAVSILGYVIDVIEAGFAISSDFDADMLLSWRPLNFHQRQSEEEEANDGVKLPFASRRHEYSFMNDHLFENNDFYVKALNQYIYGYESFCGFFETGMSFSRRQFHKAEQLLLRNLMAFGDSYFDLANDAGFPVSFENNFVYSVNLVLNINTENPDFEELLKNIDIGWKEGVALGHSIAVVTPFGNSFGFGFTTESTYKYVFKAGLEIDHKNYDITMNYKPSTKPYEIFHYKAQPFTFVYNKANIYPDPQKDSVVFIKNAEEPVEKTYQFGENYFGIGLKTTFKDYNYWNDYGSYYAFVKSFFKADRIHDRNYDWVDRWFQGTHGLVDYSIFNPTYSPFEMKVEFQNNEKNPVSEFILNIKYSSSIFNPANTEQQSGNIQHLDEFPEEHNCNIKVKLIAKGTVDREWKAHCQMTTFWPTNQLKNCSIDFERSPLPGYDDKPFKLCFRRHASYPELQNLISNPMENFQMERNAALKFGENCENDNEIHFKAIFQKTEEELRHLQSAETQALLAKCSKSLVRNQHNSKCWDEASDLFSLRKMAFDIDFKQISPSIQNCIDKLSSLIRIYFYDNLEVAEAENTDNIYIKANISRKYPVADILISKSKNNFLYKRFYIPSMFPNYRTNSLLRNLGEKYTITNFLPFESCLVTDNNVYSFDRKEFNVSWTDCYHVLARDCAQHGGFTVLARRINHPKFSKSIKVMTYADLTVEIVPNEEDENSLKIIPNTIHERKLKINNEDSPYEIYYYLGQYVVEAQYFGWRISFDGNEVNIEVSHFYRGILCGLCGDFNFEPKDDFAGPDKCIYRNPESFSYSYAVPAEGCSVPEFQCGA